ncbi:MAG: hypothetical protein WC942_01365 [Clostridia bacterium]|jgi:hypothetical protein
MESALLSIFSLVFFVFSFGIGLTVAIVRIISERLWKKLEIVIPDRFESFLLDIWKEWVLPALPIILGVLGAYFLSDYPFPSEFASSNSGRVFFGIIAGYFSKDVYRFAKYHIRKYLPKEVKEKIDSIANYSPFANDE